MEIDTQNQLYNEEGLITYIFELLENGSVDTLVEVLYLIMDKIEQETNKDILREPFIRFLLGNDDLNIEPFTHLNNSKTLSIYVAKHVLLNLYSQPKTKQKQEENYEKLIDHISLYRETDQKPLNNKTIKELISLYTYYNKDKKIAYNYY